MDLSIVNGDFAKSPNGKTIVISGIDEVKQQIALSLKTKHNSFIYNKNFGSYLHTINSATTESELYHIVTSALENMPDIKIQDISFNAETNIIHISTNITDLDLNIGDDWN